MPAPKFVWYPDNGPHSDTYINKREKLEQVNEWIMTFNRRNGIEEVPRFHTMGTRTSWKVVKGVQTDFKTHRWNMWRTSEAREDKLHLVDKMRIKMGQYVVKYFEGERRRNGSLL